jgi:beta-lactamase superfamily II metal-dependent hydrolase
MADCYCGGLLQVGISGTLGTVRKNGIGLTTDRSYLRNIMSARLVMVRFLNSLNIKQIDTAVLLPLALLNSLI